MEAQLPTAHNPFTDSDPEFTSCFYFQSTDGRALIFDLVSVSGIPNPKVKTLILPHRSASPNCHRLPLAVAYGLPLARPTKKEELKKRSRRRCSFYLHPCEGSTVQILTQGKLGAPRIVKLYFQRKRNVDNIDEGISNNVEFDIKKLPTDPGLRILILDYNANIRDEVRKAYMLKGPYQPQDHDFPKRQFEVTIRRFNPSWFKEFSSWLETSSGKRGGGESFVGEGFTYWKDKKRLHTHNKQDVYVTRLNASIDCVRLLLRQGHSLRGHDESEDSLNPGNFLVQLQFLAAHNEVINAVTLTNVPHNCKLTSPDVQKDIVNVCAIETINVIIKDVGDSLFSILVDESCDMSMKEQMSIILRYLDNSGHVNEHFIGIEHVTSTTALSLKATIDKEGPCAFYIHCFAHQLQLALVAVAKKNFSITNFFRVVGGVINTVGASSKRCNLLREKQLDFIVEALKNRSGDTRWSSHYNSLISLLAIFSSVLDVLAIIVEDESCSCDQRSDATNLLELIQKFDFAFNLQLMRNVLGMSNELSKALQRKDQDIVNAMQFVRLSNDDSK
ncbi:zinc finger MYM-type protein 1-like [Olea europaea var. sylvestris]|uniref:zinc finger MYM-type protein 1-like n=1 Tax=Olea europaea var. sylvestris TaxID=158386 RepID=UPI000C1D28EB|nr:zinc finger MYM-type protein 1-like [Olea europaea var. sylvestris]